MNAARRRQGFATLSVLLLAFALVVLVIGLSRYLSGFRSEVRLIEKKQRSRVAITETNRPPILRPAEE
jgi:uncharacterized protein YoxC